LLNKGSEPGYRIEVLRPYVLLSNFNSKSGMDEFDQFHHSKRINDSLSQQRRVIGVGEPVLAIKQPGGDEFPDGRRYLVIVNRVTHRIVRAICRKALFVSLRIAPTWSGVRLDHRRLEAEKVCRPLLADDVVEHSLNLGFR
jgi:hypothetical protein